MKLTEIISKTLKKHEGKLIMLGIATAFSGMIIFFESHKIGSYRPDGLRDGYSSYTAYNFGDSIYLCQPVIPGFGCGPIIDKRKDGTIDYVFTATYPRMPFAMNILDNGTLEQQHKTQERYQNIYAEVMAEIRKSTD